MEVLEIMLLSENATEPKKTYPWDAGLDIHAAEDMRVGPQEKVKLSTDLAVNIKPGYVGWLTSRSGIDFKTDLIVKEGKIDAGFTGHMTITVKNDSQKVEGYSYLLKDIKGEVIDESETGYKNVSYQIKKGDRIAQLVILPISTPVIKLVDKFNETERGSNGHGSTGYN